MHFAITPRHYVTAFSFSQYPIASIARVRHAWAAIPDVLRVHTYTSRQIYATTSAAAPTVLSEKSNALTTLMLQGQMALAMLLVMLGQTDFLSGEVPWLSQYFRHARSAYVSADAHGHRSHGVFTV